MERKRLAIVLALGSLVLAACTTDAVSSTGSGTGGGSEGTSAGTPSSTPPPITGSGSESVPDPEPPGPGVVQGKTAQETVDMIYELAGAHYRLDYWTTGYEEEVTTEIWSGRYVCYGGQGYVALDDWDGEGTRVYSYYLDGEGGYTLGTGVTFYDERNVLSWCEEMQDLNQIALLNYMPGWSVSENNLSPEEDGSWSTGNYYATMALSYGIGGGVYAYWGYVAKVNMAFLDDGTFKVTLIGITQDGAYLPMHEGVFSEIGTARDAGTEAAFGDFGIPEEDASGTAGSLLFGDALEINATLERVDYGEDGAETGRAVEATSRIVYTGDSYYVETKDGEGNPLDERRFLTEDGVLQERGLGLDNTVHQNPTPYGMGDFALLKDILEPEAVRKEKDGSYHYYGNRYDDLLPAVHQGVSGLGALTSIDFTTGEDGLIDEIVFTYPYYVTTEEIYTYHLTATLGAPGAIEDPEPLTGLPENEEALTYLSPYDGTSTYRARYSEGRSEYDTNISDWVDMTYDKERGAVLLERYERSNLVSRTGYLEKDGLLLPFEALEDGTVRQTGEGTPGAIEDLALHIDPTLFVEEGYETVLRDEIVTLQGGGYLGPEEVRDAYVPGTLTLDIYTYGEEEVLEGITYAYQKGTEGTRYEIITFHESEGIPEELDLGNIQEWAPPATWREESALAWQVLQVLGEDAASVPYLYDEELTGKWQPVYSAGVVTLRNEALSEDYIARYEALLAQEGFLQGEDGYWTKEEIGIEIAIAPAEGITIRKKA